MQEEEEGFIHLEEEVTIFHCDFSMEGLNTHTSLLLWTL